MDDRMRVRAIRLIVLVTLPLSVGFAVYNYVESNWATFALNVASSVVLAMYGYRVGR